MWVSRDHVKGDTPWRGRNTHQNLETESEFGGTGRELPVKFQNVWSRVVKETVKDACDILMLTGGQRCTICWVDAWKLENWYRRACFQGSNGETRYEKETEDTAGKAESGLKRESSLDVFTLPHVE